MTEVQYNALLVLYHECNEEFWRISPATRERFFNRLYAK